MNRLFTSTVIITLLPLTFAIASEAQPNDYSKCASINRDLQRLACYDLLASGKQTSNEVVLMDNKTKTKIIQTNTVAPIPASSSNFGLKEVSADSSDSLHSSIPGDFTGWEKGDKIKLANGQVWKITDSKAFHYKATNPNITIGRGMFQTFRISIDGLSTASRVVRIK